MPTPQPATSFAPLLQATGIGKRFPGVIALDNVDLSVRAGEIHALMGENGAGKSTLIKVLTGVYPRDAGSIVLGGNPIDAASPREAEAAGISTVYQEINLVPDLSVAENICLGREPTRFGMIRWPQVYKRARAALARLGLELDVTRQLSTFSVAVQQMVAIARALDTSARLLILDEPTSSLDRAEVAELFTVLRKLRESGMGIVFVTHFIEQVFAICDRITILRDGRLVGQFEAAALPRVELVARMIGKDPALLAHTPRTEAAIGTDFRDDAVITVRDLSRRGSVTALSFTAARGEILGLAGLLGSGRTEAARLLFGIDRADQGELRVQGRARRINSPRAAIRARLALTPEDRKREGIIPTLSVRENIILAQQARRGIARPLSRAAQSELCARFIAALNIKTNGPEQTISTLSGGNQQKVILARWLATDPALLILDEPTRGIDVGARAEIESLIRAQCAQGLAVILISSELEELVRLSDRAIVLRDRRQVAELAGDGLTEESVMQEIAKGDAHAE